MAETCKNLIRLLSYSSQEEAIAKLISVGDEMMISDEYNFEKFLEDIKDEDILEIQRRASREAEAAERLSSSSAREISRSEKIAIGYYRKRVSEFAFFMGHGKKPGSVDERDFELYKPICEILVKKGKLNPSVLTHFEKRD